MEEKEEYTAKRALLECIEMWSELAETGGSDKYTTAYYKRTRIGCALCHYADSYSDCTSCLLYGKWGSSIGICAAAGSVYHRWYMSSTPAERKHYASKIVDLCKQALEEL